MKNRQWILIVLVVIVIFLVINRASNTFMWASIAQGLNPHRTTQLREQYTSWSNDKLIRQLYNSDFSKHDAAAAVLAKRRDPILFETLRKMLYAKDEKVRETIRSLLQTYPDKAVLIYMGELKRSDISKSEYRQVLSLLVKHKFSGVFPILAEYTNNDYGNKHGSSQLMRDYADPRGIAPLQEMLDKSPTISEREKERVLESIEYLRSIQATKN